MLVVCTPTAQSSYASPNAEMARRKTTMKARKVRVAVAMLGLVASMAVVQLAFPGAAQARCNGGSGTTSTLIWGGDVVVSEQPLTGTCNGNNSYQGRFRGHVFSH